MTYRLKKYLEPESRSVLLYVLEGHFDEMCTTSVQKR